MCGFVGLVGAQPHPEHVVTMLESIRSRGPDDTAYVRGTSFSLGFCRLAIVALDNGHQPVSNSAKDIHLAFNGEIYNFRCIQSRLQRDDNVRTTSEADVLLRAYEQHGPSFVEELDGDFAIIVLDARSQTCYIFRDAFGVKPVYYTTIDGGHTWAFSSHLKAFFYHPNFSTALDFIALAESQVLNFWSRDRTCFEGIRQLPPGHLLKLRLPAENELAPIRPEVIKLSLSRQTLASQEQSAPGEDVDARCARLLRKAIVKRIDHSEVTPIVLALSGGIDSSLIAALAAKDSPERVMAVTLSDRPESEDQHYATQLAKDVRLAHHVYRIALSDFLDEVPRIVLECPWPHPGYFSYFLGRAVHELQPSAKVLLCGEGADEFFLGYSHYIYPELFVPKILQALRSQPRERIEASPLLQRVQNWAHMQKEDVWLDLVDIFQHDQLVNLHLVPFDHGPMAYGLECRVPFLDYEVVGFVQTIPEKLRVLNQTRKALLRLLLADALVESPELAESLLTRRKSPAFLATLRCRKWLQTFLEERLHNSRLVHSELAEYAKDAESLFWLASIATIFLKYRGRIDGISFEELADEVLHGYQSADRR